MHLFQLSVKQQENVSLFKQTPFISHVGVTYKLSKGRSVICWETVSSLQTDGYLWAIQSDKVSTDMITVTY